MSKLLPTVFSVTRPDTGAVHVHHSECAAVLPACAGSPGCAVALTFAPVAVAFVPTKVARFAKLSFAGPKLLSPKTVSVSV